MTESTYDPADDHLGQAALVRAAEYKPDPARLRAWAVDLLTPGARQAQFFLKVRDAEGKVGHCCLGRLAELNNTEWVEPTAEEIEEELGGTLENFYWGSSSACFYNFPKFSDVDQWLGVNERPGADATERFLNIFSSANDDGGKTFQEIADFLIELAKYLESGPHPLRGA